jgi:hypothetical protein
MFFVDIMGTQPLHQLRASPLAMRLVTTEEGWHEVKLRPGGGGVTTPGQALAQGDSVLVLEDIIDAATSATLMRLGMHAAEKQERSFWRRAGSFAVEFTSNNRQSKGRTRMPIAGLHSETATRFNAVLSRALTRVDESLPSVAALFQSGFREMPASHRRRFLARVDGEGLSLPSLSKLHAGGGLEFSTREPAINVYTTEGRPACIRSRTRPQVSPQLCLPRALSGLPQCASHHPAGEFNAHVDRQTLTMLIPLSPPDGYVGGGTGFWSGDAGDQRSEPPSVVLRPSPGSALLYGGSVLHAGMPVLSGCRVIFLASFSVRRFDLRLLENE